MVDKVWPSAREAVSDIFDGAMIHFSGFAGAGVPTKLIKALVEQGTRGIVGVSNHCGDGEEGLAEVLETRHLAAHPLRRLGQRAEMGQRRLEV